MLNWELNNAGTVAEKLATKRLRKRKEANEMTLGKCPKCKKEQLFMFISGWLFVGTGSIETIYICRFCGYRLKKEALE